MNYPFSLPVIRSLNTLEFKTPVSLFVGENGSRKSTLLEAMACAIDSVVVGSESLKTDKALSLMRSFLQDPQADLRQL
jgi:predicted ATPase